MFYLEQQCKDFCMALSFAPSDGHKCGLNNTVNRIMGSLCAHVHAPLPFSRAADFEPCHCLAPSADFVRAHGEVFALEEKERASAQAFVQSVLRALESMRYARP